MERIFGTTLGVAFAMVLAGSVSASSVEPISYDMQNGASGSFNYWDDSYSGSGDPMVNLSNLSGGVGDLTDGVIAADNWFNVEGPLGPNGPYVGWTIDPNIVFNFGAVHDFESVTFYFDDSNGNGGVSAPGSVSVGGTNYAVSEPVGSAPFSFTIDLTGTSTDTLTVDIFRKDGWVFLSEVDFEAVSSVPLPGAGLLLASALGAIGLRRHRHA